MAPSAALYGTVAHDAEELALADETIDLAHGGLLRAPTAASPARAPNAAPGSTDGLAQLASSAADSVQAAAREALSRVATTPWGQEVNRMAGEVPVLAAAAKEWVMATPMRQRTAAVVGPCRSDSGKKSLH